MINKYKEKLISLGLSVKKESLILLIVNAVLLILTFSLPFILMNLILFLPFCSLLVLFNVGYFARLNMMEQNKNENALFDFVDIFTFFRIYLSNGYNVYTALKEITPFASKSLSENLSKLVEEIDEDKTVEPFIRFSRNYNELIVEEIMVSIYQLIEDGNEANNFQQFEYLFDKFSEEIHKKRLQKKQSALSNLSVTALIGAAILILIVTYGVISIVGGMTSGI